MTQGLHCAALQPEVHIKSFGWRCNVEIEKISIPALCRRPNHFICTSGRNTTQRKSLHHCINQHLVYFTVSVLGVEQLKHTAIGSQLF